MNLRHAWDHTGLKDNDGNSFAIDKAFMKPSVFKKKGEKDGGKIGNDNLNFNQDPQL